MDLFLYDKDLHHERVNACNILKTKRNNAANKYKCKILNINQKL